MITPIPNEAMLPLASRSPNRYEMMLRTPQRVRTSNSSQAVDIADANHQRLIKAMVGASTIAGCRHHSLSLFRFSKNPTRSKRGRVSSFMPRIFSRSPSQAMSSMP